MELTAEAISEYLSRIASSVEFNGVLIRLVISDVVFSTSLSLCSIYESVYAFFIWCSCLFIALFHVFSCATDAEGDFLLPKTAAEICKNPKEGRKTSGRLKKAACAFLCLLTNNQNIV